MAESTIRGKIKSNIEAVDDIGKVIDYKPSSRSIAEIIEQLIDEGIVNGWLIWRDSVEAEYISNSEEEARHTYKMEGWREIESGGASEKTFQGLIEDIRAKFRFDFDLGGSCEFAGPVGGNFFEEDLGGELYHRATLSLPVQEILTP